MTVPAQITSKYEVIRRKAVKTIHISIKGIMELGPGDYLVLNPQNPSIVEVRRKKYLSTPFPYPNN
jgi:hypothetical protein